MTKHVAWRASPPTAAIVSEPCSFCPRMARYSIGIAHSMTETAQVDACADVRCVVRLYALWIGEKSSDTAMTSLAHYGAISDVLAKLVDVPSLLIQDVAYIVGADYRPLPMLIQQCKALENKADSYTRLERAA